jgi:hypothetical protein
LEKVASLASQIGGFPVREISMQISYARESGKKSGFWQIQRGARLGMVLEMIKIEKPDRITTFLHAVVRQSLLTPR